MHKESTSYRVYGKEVVCLFFTSYHAFGRADGAGAEDKMSSHRDFMNSIPRYGAASYTEMTNASNDVLSFAHELKQINRYNTYTVIYYTNVNYIIVVINSYARTSTCQE